MKRYGLEICAQGQPPQPSIQNISQGREAFGNRDAVARECQIKSRDAHDVHSPDQSENLQARALFHRDREENARQCSQGAPRSCSTWRSGETNPELFGLSQGSRRGGVDTQTRYDMLTTTRSTMTRTSDMTREQHSLQDSNFVFRKCQNLNNYQLSTRTKDITIRMLNVSIGKLRQMCELNGVSKNGLRIGLILRCCLRISSLCWYVSLMLIVLPLCW